MQQRFLDGVQRTAKPMLTTPKASAAPTPAIRPQRPFQKPAPAKVPTRAAKRPSERMQLILIILLAMAGGLCIRSSAIGQVLIAGYGIVAVVFGISSRITFSLALTTLIALCVVLLGQGDVAFSGTLATYTFLFLVAGVISLGRELNKEGGRVYSIRSRRIHHH